MNNFDVEVVLYLSHLVGRHYWLAKTASLILSTNLLGGGVLVLLVWLALFDSSRPGQLQKGFELLLGSVFFSLFATLIARGVAISLPFRARPFATSSLHLQLPISSFLVLINWSSFPSDHATLFFALASGILMVSRRMGYFAFAWVVFFICLPLLCLGVHWPTDIIAGTALGVSFAQMARIPAFREFSRRTITKWHQNHARFFFAALFLWSYETVILYDDVRRFLMRIAHSFRT
jgi:undecaprenyl-diphosphatase